MNTTDPHLERDPLARFADAMRRAAPLEPFQGARAALATVDASGAPAVRFVLVKECFPEGFPFFTNYESPKARELDHAGTAALAWHWDSIGEQVRATGRVVRADAVLSDRYFAERPRGSQLGAWASRQSEVIESRDELLARVADYEAKFAGGPVPRPPFWGGYLLLPERIEFWREGEFRLHDRFLYARGDGGWSVRRLSP